MLAARMCKYHKPLVLEDIKVPEIAPDQVLVNVNELHVHSIKRMRFQDINDNLELLPAGDIIGRAVIVFDVDGGSSGSGNKRTAVNK
jgi:D-arabinose 1-dehydrogenase-like Zn-dependent alcohol dehydrogenase